ncbi:hypothetical protein DSM112329_04579 [Paraconexibacter sp. AEG42_29]|uniref:Spirocyclase, AveC family n=1 Tax=Paraconexibacter sp. AEG42_29 TaxID=2997339 RepID=A0AAU7B117_9ACTN
MAVMSPRVPPTPLDPPPPVTGVGVGIVAGQVELDREARGVHGGMVGAWAVLGALLVGLTLSIWVRWVTSGTEFDPAPILGPDKVPTWNLVVLRIEEALSFLEMAALFAFAVYFPLKRFGKLGLDAKIALGCLIGSVTDGVLNMHDYLFAWNANSVNMGSWASFVPTASPDHKSRYAEALIWGIPMYTYFCIGVAIYATKWIVRWRRDRGWSNARCYGVVFAIALVFDFVVENLVIRLGHGYAFARTPSALTINAGSQFQFPVYEMVSVALLGCLFTGLRLSAIDSPDGLSYVERGFHRLRPALQAPARWLAVIGWCVTTLFVVYHLPFQFFGLTGDSVADLPSYMLPGDKP